VDGGHPGNGVGCESRVGDHRRTLLLTAALFGAVALAMAGGGATSPGNTATEEATEPALQQTEKPRGQNVGIGSVRRERRRGSVRAPGSSAATRKRLAQRPTIDLSARFGWHPDEPTIIADEAGRPWINLEDGRDLEPVYAGAEETLEKLDRELGEPLALASADFDEDGVPDLITTYAAASSGGFVTIHIGNPDSIYPHAPEARRRKSAGTFTEEPFLTPALAYPAPVAPVWVGAGDFDADGHKDLVLAASGGESLFHLPGDGMGGFGEAREIALPGPVTAMTVGEINRRDGLEDVVVALNGDRGPEVLVFEWPEGALHGQPETITVADEVTDLTLGQLDGEYLARDLAFVAGGAVSVVRGRDRRLTVAPSRRLDVPRARVDRIAIDQTVIAVVAGDFTRAPAHELAVLDDLGALHVVELESADDGGLTSRSPLTIFVGAVGSGDTPPSLVRGRTSSLPLDDVLVVDRSGHRVQVVPVAGPRKGVTDGSDWSVAEPPLPTSLAVDDDPVAVLPLRLNRDALSDIVVLKRGGSPLAVTTTKSHKPFTVNLQNHAEDYNLDDDRCDTDEEADGDQCSLHAAIRQANNHDGLDTILFSVPKVDFERGYSIEEPLTIDGSANGRVLITTRGLSIQAGSSTIRNLVVDTTNSVHISISRGDGGNIIEGCYVGTDVDGTSPGAEGGTIGIRVYRSPGNLIGGTTAAARNVVSGTGKAGIDISDSIEDPVAIGNRILGNYVGTDKTGEQRLENFFEGISLANCPETQVGGVESGAGNVISGNRSRGMHIFGTVTGTLIQGNFIGTDKDGNQPLGNGFPPTSIYEGIGTNEVKAFTIGGTTAASGNVISANTTDGIRFFRADAGGCVVQGNFIGTDVTGLQPLGNQRKGIYLFSENSGLLIGGAVTGTGNVIANSGEEGISGGGADESEIFGNLIGVAVDRTTPMGNGDVGVSVTGHHDSRKTVGGTDAGEPNIIAHNAGHGVYVFRKHGAVRGNSIHSNGGLGINYGGPGVFENDPMDEDGIQNYPVLTTEGGTLNSTPNTTFTIDLYTNTECDPSGHGEGETWVTSLSVTTDGDGNASFPISAFGTVTATATSPDGDTSEFSACLGAGEPERNVRIVAASQVFAAEDTQVTIQVLREGGGIDTGYDGSVGVRLEPGTTTDLAKLRTASGQTGQTVTVQVSNGVGSVSLITPEKELTADSVITPQTVLEGTAVLKASLADDKTDTATVKVKSPIDLKVKRIEIQQGAQKDEPDEMIRDRLAMVRVFVAANIDEFSSFKTIEGITAKLHVKKGNGQPIEGSPFELRFGGGVASSRPDKPFVLSRAPTDKQRHLGEDAFNHLLSTRQVNYDKLTFSAELDDVYPDRRRGNDSTSVGPLRFKQSKSLTILYSRGRLSQGNVQTQFPDEARIARAFDVLYLTYPVSSPKFQDVKFRDKVFTRHPFGTPTAQLAYWMNRLDETSAVAVAYFVDNDFLSRLYPPPDRAPLGVANGFGGTVILVNLDVCQPPKNDCSTLPHEVGHIFGLGDTYTTGRESVRPDINPKKPNGTRRGNPVEDGTFNWFNAVYVVRQHRYEADYMGNSGSRSWTDQVDWDHVKSKLFNAASTPKVHDGPTILVRGLVVRAGGTEIGTCYTLDGLALSESVAGGSHLVETIDGSGAVLDTLGFGPDYHVTDTNEELDEYHFGFVLPFSEDVKKVRIKTSGVVLDSIDISENDPSAQFETVPSGTVTGTHTVSWSGSDSDGDALVYSLFYSPDGSVQVPLLEETSDTSYEWTSDEDSSGPAPRLVLVTSDGVRSTITESAVFEVPDRKPAVYISEPLDGARFKPSDAVPLNATVHDPEDGIVSDAEVAWSSDRDGALGNGKALAAEGLSVGSHTITASFADLAGNTGSDSVIIEVTNGPVCSLTCAPSAPGTVTVGEQFDFDAGVSASSCTDPIEYIWDFGDGSAESSTEDPSHQYLEDGFYSWQLIAAAGTSYCSESGGLAVSGGMDYGYLIPASAHAAGAEGTNWVTDVVLHDPGATTALGGMYFHEKDRDNSSVAAEAVLVGRGYSLRLDDVVEDTFGEGSTSGAILVSSTEPLIVSSRTYNKASGGTYGQYVPGLPSTEAIEEGDEVRLIQLTRNDDFRTNIGFASLTAWPINVIVDLYRADGSSIRAKSYPVEAYGYRQINDIIGKLASGDVDEAYAIVRSKTAGARYFTYASIVDNSSGDPVLILPVSSSEADSGPCGLDGWESLDPGGEFADFDFGGGFSNGSRHFLLGIPGVIVTSTDGDNWNSVPSGTEAYLTGGAWSGSRFVIVGRNGVILTSNNGTSWTTRSSGISKILSDVVWGAGKFVAVGDDGTILTSTDGVSWTSRTSGTTQDLWGVAWNGSTFVVVGRSDALGGGTVLTSGNGTSWTSRTAASGSGWPYHVAWGSGKFVSVGLSGDIATSPNGVSWTARVSGVGQDLLGIVWDGTRFVVAGSGGVVLSSANGTAWTRHQTGTNNRLQAAVWTGDRHVVAGLGATVLGTRACVAGEPLWITAGAHAEGVGGTNWVTDLEIHNPDDTRATVTVSLLPKGINNTYHETEELAVEAGSSRRIADVLYSLFDFTGAAALRIEARGAAVMVGSRTYNNAPAGTFGQFVPGVPESQSVSGGSVRLVQLSRSANLTSGFRTNIGFTNMDGSKISMTVELYDGSGNLLGTTQHNVKPYGQNQITDIFGRVTSGDVANGYAIISSSTPGARFLTYASVVDNRSGDPIYIPAN